MLTLTQAYELKVKNENVEARPKSWPRKKRLLRRSLLSRRKRSRG